MAWKKIDDAKLTAIADNIRIRTAETDSLSLDDMTEAILRIGTATDAVCKAVGTTFPPKQKPADSSISGYDLDCFGATSDDILSYIDTVAGLYPHYATREVLGKDASGNFDIARYTLAHREHCAWRRKNYPKMYAWKNGDSILYSQSISPRIGDMLYAEKYVSGTGTTTETVTTPPKAVLLKGYRYSHSGQSFSALDGCASLIVPVDGATTLSWTHFTTHSSYTGIYAGSVNNAFANTVDGNTATYEVVSGNTQPWNEVYASGGNVVDGLSSIPAGDNLYIVFFIKPTLNSGEYDGATLKINGVDAEIVITANTADASLAAHAATEEITVEGSGGFPVTAVSATNRSRMVSGLEYARYEAGDVEPTVIYTAVDDERNTEAAITVDGITYERYPLGDLGYGMTKLTPIFIYANEHGVGVRSAYDSGQYETKMCALVAARMIRDLCSGRLAMDPLYKAIRENCMLIVIPVANPYGYNHFVHEAVMDDDINGYNNANGVNINRNYDTPGWDLNVVGDYQGDYPGSEIETQYIMNTMAESGAVVAMSLHGLTSWANYCCHQGQDPDGSDYNQEKLEKVVNFLLENYSMNLIYYDRDESTNEPIPSNNLPDTTSKSPSYITQCGAYGGIVEFQPDDPTTGIWSEWEHCMTAVTIECAYAQTLNLLAMWLSDYWENSHKNN